MVALKEKIVRLIYIVNFETADAYSGLSFHLSLFVSKQLLVKCAT